MFRDSLRGGLESIFHSQDMDIPGDVAYSIDDFITGLFAPDGSGGFKKAPKGYSGNTDSHGLFHVIPGGRETDLHSDTLVVYCMGSDNLLDRLVDTIIAVGKHGYRNVLFFTTKWDVSVVTGNNAKRLQDLMDFRAKGTRFCFILASTSGIAKIPVI